MGKLNEYIRKTLGQQQDYASPLPASVTPDQTFTAAAMSGRLPAVGAQIQLAPEQVAIAPLNTRGAQKILGVGGRLAGASSVGALVKPLGKAAESQARVIPYEDITAVRRGTGAGVLSPPTLRIETRSGGTQEVGIATSLFTPNWSKANVSLRDSAARAIAERAGLEYGAR